MDLGLRGRVALVCAASQGLGKATAAAFAREGAHVVICSRDRRRLAAAAAEIRRASPQGVSVVPVAADLTKPAHINRLVATAVKQFGRLDILVTNAGGPPVGEFPDLDDAAWEKGIALNLLSTIRCIRAALPHMRRRKWGRIIAITSLTAKQPLEDLVISSTVRPGILGLTRVLSNQFASEGILVNSVAPGFIRTARQEEIGRVRGAKLGISGEDYMEKQAAGIPARRLGTPEELADVIVFLGSERASYVSGTTLSVDGGFVKGLF